MNDPLRKYRVRFRLWKNSRKLKREKNYYQKRFRQMEMIIPDAETLRSEFINRFSLIIPKNKGEFNIIAIYHHYNWENYSLKPALDQFGAVRHYDWFEKFNHQSTNWHKSIKAKMNLELISQVNQWMTERRADVIFTYLSGELVEPETLRAIRKHGVPIINLALNDKENFIGKIQSGRAWGARDICSYFDLCWTSTQDALIKYCVEGALPLYLPEGANPAIHKPYDIEKSIDVSFVGQCYGNRTAVIDELKRRGISVEAYGTDWPNGPLSTEEMVKTYSRSKINLGFGGVAGHKNTFCLKGRDFEIPMSGGLYLTEDHPELAIAFRPGVEILTYSGIEDLLKKIKYYLYHPSEAEAVRTKGYKRALRDHTWEGRFEKIFRLIGLLR
jgi:spore maturation protein CgeB